MFNSNTINIILPILLATIIISSCSKKYYPVNNAPTKPKVETGTKTKSNNYIRSEDSKELTSFFAAGVEKPLPKTNTSSTNIIKTAKSYLGVPHCMGGNSKKCTDCSGFVLAVFREHGINLPHNSEEQARYGQIIREKSTLKKGDLVFFINSYKTSRYITHSGIYIGNNEFIHTSSKQGVTITSLDNSWWKDKFVFGTRILNNK